MKRIYSIWILLIVGVLYGAEPLLFASFQNKSDAESMNQTVDRTLKSIDAKYGAKVIFKKGMYQVVSNKALDERERARVTIAIRSYFDIQDKLKLKRQRKSLFSGNAVIGIGYADNVYQHTEIGQTPYADMFIENNTTQLSDYFHREIIVLKHHYQFPDIAWQWDTKASIYNKQYSVYDDLNILQASVSTAPKYLYGKHSIVLPIYVKKLWYGGSPYSESYGLTPQYQYEIDKRYKWGISFDITEKRFIEIEQKDYNSNRLALKGKLKVDAESGLFIIASSLVGVRKTQGGRFDVSYNEMIFSGIYFMPTWKDLHMYVKMAYALRTYTEKHPNLAKREDTRGKVVLGISKKINKDITARLTYGYQKVNSNINLFSYEKNSIILNLSTAF